MEALLFWLPYGLFGEREGGRELLDVSKANVVWNF